MVAQARSSQRWIALVALCAALLPSAWLAWSWRAMPQTGLFHDDAIYLVSAKALAEGRGYRIASLPGEPFQTKYPPLYPALLSVIWRVDPSFPANLSKVMLLAWIALAGSVLLAWRLFATAGGFGEWESVGLASFLALSPAMVQFGVLAMSELPFCVLVFACLIAAERGNAVWAGVWAALAFLTRGAALPLLVTVPAVFIWRQRGANGGKGWRAAGLFVAIMLPAVAGWQWWAAAHRAAPDPLTLFYTDYFGYHRQDVPLSEWPDLAAFNLNPLVKALAELVVFDEDGGLVALTIARLLMAAMVLGTVRLIRQGRFLQVGCFGVAYLLQFLFWNYPPTHRFLLPLAPLAVAGVWTELKSLGGIIRVAYAKKGADRVVAAGMASLLVLLGVSTVKYAYDGLFRFLPPVFASRATLIEEKRAAYAWMAGQSDTQALLSYQDPLDYLYTGRRGYSLRVPPSLIKRGDKAELARFFGTLPAMMQEHGVGLVVLGPADYQMDRPDVTLKAYRDVITGGKFELAFKHGGTRVYRVKQEMASAAPAPPKP